VVISLQADHMQCMLILTDTWSFACKQVTHRDQLMMHLVQLFQLVYIHFICESCRNAAPAHFKYHVASLAECTNYLEVPCSTLHKLLNCRINFSPYLNPSQSVHDAPSITFLPYLTPSQSVHDAPCITFLPYLNPSQSVHDAPCTAPSACQHPPC